MLHVIYLLALVGVVVVCLVLLKKRLVRFEQQSLTYRQQISTLRGERDLVEIERSDLEASLKQARFDLLQLSKNYHDRTTLLQSLHRKVTKMIEADGASVSQLKKLLSILDKDADQEKDALIIHLEQVNSNYVDRLKDIHPSLTVYDYRLCTFIKTGMSTREIANLLNVLPSSVNVSRSRLRKKLALEPKQDLYTVLNEI